MNNKFERGNNTVEYWNDKHHYYGIVEKPYAETMIKNWENDISDQGCAIAFIKENQNAILRKSLVDVGCAHGILLYYLKENVIKDWELVGYDFSDFIINNNASKYNKVKWEQRDILEFPIDREFGVITCIQTIEHFAEGDNYKLLDNMLDHCEYAIIATVDTIDSCFGEHLSHYTIDTFDNLGYDVIWKSKFDKIDMSNVGDYGDYHYILFIIKGKLCK